MKGRYHYTSFFFLSFFLIVIVINYYCGNLKNSEERVGNGIWPSVLCSVPSVTLKTRATKAKLVLFEDFNEIEFSK